VVAMWSSTDDREKAWQAAQTAAFEAFLERHHLDLEYFSEATDAQRAELAEIEARIDAEHGYDPLTLTFR